MRGSFFPELFSQVSLQVTETPLNKPHCSWSGGGWRILRKLRCVTCCFLFSESRFYIPKRDKLACVAWVRYVPLPPVGPGSKSKVMCNKHGSKEEIVPVIGGLIKEKNLTLRWQRCTHALLGSSWAGLHGGGGRWPQGRGPSGDSSWRAGVEKRRRTWKFQGRA